MSGYYYFAASLPTFAIEGPLPFPASEFRDACARHLAPAELRALGELDGPLLETSSHPFVARWKEAEIEFRNAIARLRAARKREDPGRHLRRQTGVDLRSEHAASEAFSKNSPIERELALDRFRWRRIEELAGLDAFSGSAILAYSLKLKLAERWSALDEEAGTARAAQLTRRVKS